MLKIKDQPVSAREVVMLLQSEEAQKTFCHAYDIAMRLYGDERTIADLLRIDHGLRTAKTLVEMERSLETVIAGLLNHVAEKEAFALVSAEFSPQITNKLYVLRKLDIYTEKSTGRNDRTQEAIRQAALSVIDGDVQVVVIRLVMALHTLSAAGKLDEIRRTQIATDVLNIYAPLANRLGIWSLKWQLEDMAFRYQQPQKYKEIAKSLDEKRNERDARIQNAKARLREGLAELGISAEVTGRPKHIYSIYRKMERKKVGFEEIYDAHALRIILDQDDPENPALTPEKAKSATYAQTYRALGLIHSYWTPIPTEYDDYIQYPKPNGYRSLHTAVYDEDGTILEIQIRTRQMHEEAEQGFAAHWAYKEGGGRPKAAMLNQIESLRQVLSKGGDRVKEAFDPANEEPEKKAEKRIYVFTPKGDVYDLPEGATPLDMAYVLHTALGHRTRGAIVNGKMVNLKYKLCSGDEVRIDTFGRKDDKHFIGRPQREWMNPHSGYAFTSKTRNRVRAWFRKHERSQHIEQGRAFVERELKQHKLRLAAEEIAAQFDCDPEDLYAKIGFGDITHKQFDGAVALVLRDRREELEAEIVETPQPLRQTSKKRKGLRVMGQTGFETHMAQCCKPISPEPILGYVTRGRGVTIHRVNCRQIAPKKLEEPERIVDADWGEDNDRFHVPFRIKSFINAHLLEDIVNVLRPQNIGIVKTKKVARPTYQSLYLETEVRDLGQAEWVKKRLEGLSTVFEVQAR